MGLNFKLDVGLYRLDQQVACQRYRQQEIDAETESTFGAAVNRAIALRDAALKTFAVAPLAA